VLASTRPLDLVSTLCSTETGAGADAPPVRSITRSPLASSRVGKRSDDDAPADQSRDTGEVDVDVDWVEYGKVVVDEVEHDEVEYGEVEYGEEDEDEVDEDEVDEVDEDEVDEDEVDEVDEEVDTNALAARVSIVVGPREKGSNMSSSLTLSKAVSLSSSELAVRSSRRTAKRARPVLLNIGVGKEEAERAAAAAAEEAAEVEREEVKRGAAEGKAAAAACACARTWDCGCDACAAECVACWRAVARARFRCRRCSLCSRRCSLCSRRCSLRRRVAAVAFRFR
jgi:hypothetical protein